MLLSNNCGSVGMHIYVGFVLKISAESVTQILSHTMTHFRLFMKIILVPFLVKIIKVFLSVI